MAGVKKQANGPSRQERTAANRRRMLTAAYELFCELGFRATTMEAIAARAGVAVQTLYFTFHTKDALLQEVHNWTVLGDEVLPPPEQPWYLAAVAEPDLRDALAHVVHGSSAINARVAPMVPVYQAVATEPAGAVWQHAEALRRTGYGHLLGALVRKAPLRPGLTRRRAVDLMLVLLGPEVYRSLVLGSGWTPAQWSTWVAAAVGRDLFGLG